MKVPIATF